MSRVIRGPGAPPRIVPGEVVDARAEADRVLASARSEAEALLASARADAERLREEARRAGVARGHEEIAAALIEAARARDEALSRTARDAQALALAASAKIVGETMVLAPERIEDIVRDAVARARRARSVEVRVSPDDAARLEQGAAGLPALRVVADPTITRGGCVVRSELGAIDARVEVRLEAMAKLLGCA